MFINLKYDIFNIYMVYHEPHEEYIAEMRKCLKSEGLLASDFTCNDEVGNKATD